MKTETLIIGLAVILAIAIPLALLSIKNNKKKKAFLQKLNDFAKKNNCLISESDHWNSTLIGIDKTAGKLFYIKSRPNVTVEKVISLDDIQKCRIVNTSRTVKTQDQSNTVIDKLELAFTHHDKNKADATIEFYNNTYDGLTLNNELMSLEKWHGLINAVLLDRTKK